MRSLPAAEPDLARLPPDYSDGAQGSSEISPLQAAVRHKFGILCFALVLTGLVSIYVRHLPVRYTTYASIMIDTRRLQVMPAQSVLSNPLIDNLQMQTYLEMFHSEAIARDVVEELDLTHNPEYCTGVAANPVPGQRVARGAEVPGWRNLGSRLAGLLAPPTASPDSVGCSTSKNEAVEHLLGSVSGSIDGRSYIIKVVAEAGSPDLAAKIANAYASAYVLSQRRQATEATELADAWLTKYLESIRTKMQAADSAVETYQQQNQLTPVRGETLISQRLGELNSQLATATSLLAEKQSALRQVQAVLNSGGPVDASAAVLASPAVQRLVQKQADLQASEADLRTRFGGTFPQVQSVAAQLEKTRQALQVEVNKVVLGLADEVAALTARKASLLATVQSLQSATGEQGSANVRLQELRRDADTEHHLYESMLTRLHEVDAERHMQWPDSSVAVAARPPKTPSFPRTNMILTGVFMVSLGVGAGLAFALCLLSPRFRDIDQVEGETRSRVLGLLPRPPRRVLAKDIVLARPNSLEAETVALAFANLVGGRGRSVTSEGWVVMVTSAVPGEGKSSSAVALGHAAVQVGMSVALLECDLRSNAMTQLAGKRIHVEPLDQSFSGSEQSQLTTMPDRSYLHVLPVRSLMADSQRLVVSSKFAAFVRALRAQYDLVLIDTPPILAVPDALTLAPLIDDTVLIIDWRKTKRSFVAATMRVLRRANITITGIMLSKVNLRKFARLPKNEGFYARGYKSY